MHNSIANNLKSYSAIPGKRKITCSLFNSNQNFVRENLIEFILKSYKNSDEKKVDLICFRPKEAIVNNYKSSKSIITHEIAIEEFESVLDLIKKSIEECKSSIIVFLGIELLTFHKNNDCFLKMTDLIKNGLFGAKIKFVHFVCFFDQFSSYHFLKALKSSVNFIFDFSDSKKDGKFLIDCHQISDTGFNIYEKIETLIDSNGMTFSRIDDDKKIVKKVDPDKMMSTTFKLGISEQEKNEKDKIILPYIKEKEQNNDHKISDEDTLELEIDEEQDVDDDFDV